MANGSVAARVHDTAASRARALLWRGAAGIALTMLLAACGGGGDDADGDGGGGGGRQPPVLTSIVVAPADAIVGIGLTKTVSAEARDQNGAAMSGIAFTWASSNGAVGRIDGGVATGVAAGTTEITASSGGVASNAARLTVVAVRKASVVVDRPAVFLSAVGQTVRLSAQPFDAAGLPSAAPVTWTSSAPDKVSIDASGQVVALAVGSAQLVAEANGVRSAPTLVMVATPKPGALLLRDAEIVSVGAPLVPAGTPAGVGTTYEVALRGVAAPLPGTVVLATEMAPVAGKVMSVRAGAAGPVLTLAVAPLYELLDAYDIRFSLSLEDFIVDAASAPAPAKRAGVVWDGALQRPAGAPAARLQAAEPFKPFKCEASLESQLPSKTHSIRYVGNMKLEVQDRPGYSKRALEGSADIVGEASLKLQLGFKATGSCRAKLQVEIPVGGVLALFIMPGISLGLGADVEGEVRLVQGELGVDGTVGLAGSVGYECGGATPDCRGLDTITTTRKLNTKSKLPSRHDVEAEVSAHFYVFAGLDAVFFLGLTDAEIVEAKVGPKQTFRIARARDQAARKDYASDYELTFEGSIEPGSALKEAIAKVTSISADNITFNANLAPVKLAESPKGKLALDKTRARPGQKVGFSVDLQQPTTIYSLLGYNVKGLELWRKREDEADFTFFATMAATATNGTNFRHEWTPADTDAGKYEFTAFVDTDRLGPMPLLEIEPDSSKPLEVLCFSGAKARAKGSPMLHGPSACVDTFDGTSTVVSDTPGAPGNSITATANITWVYDPANSVAGVLTRYKATGRIEVAMNSTNGCTFSLSPKSFAILDEPMRGSAGALGLAHYDVPPSYGFSGMQMITTTVTAECPGRTTTVTRLEGFQVGYALGRGPYTGQATLEGSTGDAAGSSTWKFVRP